MAYSPSQSMASSLHDVPCRSRSRGGRSPEGGSVSGCSPFASSLYFLRSVSPWQGLPPCSAIIRTFGSPRSHAVGPFPVLDSFPRFPFFLFNCYYYLNFPPHILPWDKSWPESLLHACRPGCHSAHLGCVPASPPFLPQPHLQTS